MKKFLFLLPLLVSTLGYSDSGERPELIQGPWFTGPLLTPSAYTVPQGHVNIEPYTFVNRKIGDYNSHWQANSQGKSTSGILQLPIQIGLTSFMDFQTFPFAIYTNTGGQTATRFGDLTTQVNFQVLKESPGCCTPAIRVSLSEDFPTGKYEHLNPRKNGADASGTGSYVTILGVVFGKLIKFTDSDFLRLRFNANYSIPSAVDVEGFNAYGGGFGTKGKVYPGNEFSVLIGLEYTPTLHLAFALDIFGVTTQEARFSGHPGLVLATQKAPPTSEGLPPFVTASVGNRSSEQLSLAPAIEYNFTETVGFIGGVWFSIVGRNSSRFVNGVVALNMYF